MKVLIPNFPTTDSFVDNVAFTLRAMGHEVVTPLRPFDRLRSGPARFLTHAWRQAFPQHWTQGERFAIAAAKLSRPDLVLCLTQSLRQEVIENLRGLGVRRLVAWWGDSPANMQGLGLLADAWDHIFIKDAAAVGKFRAVDLPADLMHEAMNPVWHRPAYSAIGESIAVAGSYYGYRQFLVLRLMSAGVQMDLHGPRPPRWADPAILAASTGRFIVKEEKSTVFGSALACLNSTALSEGDSLNCRAFEIAGAAGLQLIEDKPAVADCFEPGREVLVYRSVEDIVDYLARARSEPAWALSIREAGYVRANAEHSYHHRLDAILKRIGLDAA